jgi:hypothetical protein
MEEKWSTVSGGIQCFHFREKIGRGDTCFRREKENKRRLLVPTWRGAEGCSDVTVADSQSRTTFGLTQGGRRPVETKCCLDWILLWKSNRQAK